MLVKAIILDKYLKIRIIYIKNWGIKFEGFLIKNICKYLNLSIAKNIITKHIDFFIEELKANFIVIENKSYSLQLRQFISRIAIVPNSVYCSKNIFETHHVRN